MIIAIDGPAGSGKSSTAKEVAKRLGFRHLDSGAFYRAITYAALEKGIPSEEWKHLDHPALDDLKVRSEPGERGFDLFVDDRDVTTEIRSAEVNAHVSPMAAVPAVREWLMDQLRAAAESSSLVADGRDIGTVVFPEADLKVFLIAQSETRAKRRLAETGNANPSYVDIQNEVDRLGLRDRIDSTRATAPLKQAADAVVIDTSHITFEDQVERIVRLAETRLNP
ncbi:MAG TPA: (d)CMP kinase [Longimicrobiales bacterium]|nr:(d)CMP kinase [Longimicrobiales bacterium]